MGILLSIAALALEEFNFRRHQRTRDIVSQAPAQQPATKALTKSQ